MAVPAGAAVFAVAALPSPGAFVLDGPEGRHAAQVRRLRVGESLVLTDGCGGWAPATVTAVGRGELSCDVRAGEIEPPPLPKVTVVQALPKGERSELAVELATEAGADVIVPWSAQRCVARWDADRAERGQQRWRQVAAEAGKQARRTRFPRVEPLHSTSQVDERLRRVGSSGGRVLLLHESATRPLRSVELPDTEIVLVVGPEGGLTDRELADLTDAGGVPVRLGPQVLRTSTAAAVALGALGVLTDRWV
jgi:16S rRNA (uracil1498-N3)-methyltransferase